MKRFLFERSENKDTRNGEESINDGLHDQDLFDKNEDNSGERYDLATGKPIDNSTMTELDGLTITGEFDSQDNDLAELEEAVSSNKEASEWLRKHANEL